MNLWKLFHNLSFPDGDSGPAGGGSPASGQDNSDSSMLDQDLDELGGEADDEDLEGEEDEDEGEGDEEEEEGEEKKEKKEKKPPKKDEKDEDKDEEEEEEDDKEETEEEKAAREEAEAKAPVRGKPTPQQLAKAGVFKQFPGMRTVYYEHGEFQKLFSDPKQAEEIVTKASYFDDIEGSVLAGNPRVLLDDLKKNQPEAFKKFTGNLLATIQEMDQDAYFNIITPVIEDVLHHAKVYGTKHNNPNFEKAAKWIADFMFGNGGVIPDVSKRYEKHPAEIELEKERKANADRDHHNAMSDVNARTDTSLSGYVAQGLDRRLSTFEKEYITNKSLDELTKVLAKDTNFGLKMRGLWTRAKTSGYSEQSKAGLINAYTARSKNVLREIRDRLTAEALKGRGINPARHKPKGAEEEEEQNPQRTPKKRNFDSAGRGGAGGRRPTVLDSSKIDYRQTKDIDIIMDNGGDRVKFKRS